MTVGRTPGLSHKSGNIRGFCIVSICYGVTPVKMPRIWGVELACLCLQANFGLEVHFKNLCVP